MKPLEGIDYIREKVRIRDKHTCQICFNIWKPGERRFDVHHLDIKMESIKNYSYDSKNQDRLVTLCHKCHLNLPHNTAKISKVFSPKKGIIIRSREIFQMWLDGCSTKEIGAWYNISSERVRQIIESPKHSQK